MTKLAADRDTHLSAAEIAAEALRQFDERRSTPSIRSLAAALRVTPAAIYHHFPSQAAIFQAAVELVWSEGTSHFLALVPRPLAADPVDVLVASGIATRRAWLAHYRLAPYMAATPDASEVMNNVIGLMGALFERLGLKGERAAAALHSYSTYTVGGVLFAAMRKAANEELADAPSERADTRGRRYRSEPPPGVERRTSPETRLSMDQIMNLSTVDPQRDEELFAQGLRRLIESLMAT